MNSMSIVLLLQMVGVGIGVGLLIYNRVWEGGTRGGYYLAGFVVDFFFSLVLLSFVFSCLLSLFLIV